MSIKRINNLKQSIWTDFLSRAYLESGGMESHISAGVSGVTSNPTILNNAISGSSIYDKEIAEFVEQGKDTQDIYEEIIRRDVQVAAHLLYEIFVTTNGDDGYVSIEVDPAIANRIESTIYQAAFLYNLMDVPNVMIKIPATDAGIEAFRQVIFEGISVNMTLLFSVEQYRKVAQAYVDALKDREKDGQSLSDIASVASFFVSRIDTAVDGLLKLLPTRHPASGSPHSVVVLNDDHIENMLGKAAIANARQAYAVYHEIFHGAEFVKLRKQGARPQRLLWASTSTKNPEYDPLKYVKGLIAKNTVNTLPPATLNTIMEGKDSLQAELESYSIYSADEHMEHLRDVGVDFKQVTDKLLQDGIRAFSESFDNLMASLYVRVKTLREKKYASRDSKPRYGLV